MAEQRDARQDWIARARREGLGWAEIAKRLGASARDNAPNAVDVENAVSPASPSVNSVNRVNGVTGLSQTRPRRPPQRRRGPPTAGGSS